jgi:hypothetical protein
MATMKIMRWTVASSLLCGLMLFSPAPADAAPVYCAVQPAGGLSTSNVTFRSGNSDDCFGVVTNPQNPSTSGNPSGWTVNTLAGGLFGGGWESFVKDDGGVGTLNNYLGVNWTLSAPQQATSGNWSLTLADPAPANLPVTVDMLVVLKASNRWASYLFKAETFTLVGSNPGTFQINFVNGGGQIPGLSNMAIYFRQAATSVPEPATLTLLGLGLLSFSFLQRRKVANR